MCGGIAVGVVGQHTQGLKGATRKILHTEIYIVAMYNEETSECHLLWNYHVFFFGDAPMQS